MPKNEFEIFLGQNERPAGPSPLPPAVRDARRDDPRFYEASKELRGAVNVALHLARPLLVTGEPGTGKTQLAYRMAYELTPHMPEPLRYQTKARAEATDLFYRYDALRHFQEVHVSQNRAATARDFLRLEALGVAILRASADRDAANRFLEPKWQAPEPVRSVVLIDEIDKAPRDLPNDLLAEIENMSFEIKETGDRFQAAHEFRPVVLITSNSERDLPAAFLRRCVYFHIPLPDQATLRKIVEKRIHLNDAFSPAMLDNALARFQQIRDRVGKKKPATDELIAWVNLLNKLNIDPKNPQPGQREALAFTYSVLAKDPDDLKALQDETLKP